jgi:hypothetical protein
MAKIPAKKRHEGKPGTFSLSKKPRRGLSEKTERGNEDFRGRKDKPADHFGAPRRAARDLPEKADRMSGDLRGRGEGRSFSSFDRPKREPGFAFSEKTPMAPVQPETVSVAALKRGFERARDEITGMCDEISALMTDRYNIGQVELTVSFNSRGEFIGLGAGGAASIKITIIPSK